MGSLPLPPWIRVGAVEAWLLFAEHEGALEEEVEQVLVPPHPERAAIRLQERHRGDWQAEPGPEPVEVRTTCAVRSTPRASASPRRKVTSSRGIRMVCMSFSVVEKGPSMRGFLRDAITSPPDIRIGYGAR